MSETRRFLSLEDEAVLRSNVRKTYKHEGMEGVYKCMAELRESIAIIGELAAELLEEENKK